MRAPGFWWRKEPGLLAELLRPLSLAYGFVAGRRLGREGVRAGMPVVCIGNCTAGGAGKTPTALAVAEFLAGAGESPAFLTRGYGGSLSGPVQVGESHRAREVGDEPLLLARTAPAIVSRDRPAGAELAREMGATVLVMDDGLQNPSLFKDCCIAVVDGGAGFGNGMTIPSGPLRAPLPRQWPRIDAVLVIGPGAPGDAAAEEGRRQGKRVFRGLLEPDPEAAESLRGLRVLAFAGIGRPSKFFDTLRACGADLVRTRAFPDHHPYDASQIAALREEARREGLVAVTTEKDLVRIGDPGDGLDGFRAVPVRLRVEGEDGFRNFVLRRVREARLRVAAPSR